MVEAAAARWAIDQVETFITAELDAGPQWAGVGVCAGQRWCRRCALDPSYTNDSALEVHCVTHCRMAEDRFMRSVAVSDRRLRLASTPVSETVSPLDTALDVRV
jgi:hypothetical protein